jgi:predicted small metal-binding protein
VTDVVRCGELFAGCPGEARGETQDELLRQVAEHARRDHGLAEIGESALARVKAAVRTA